MVWCDKDLPDLELPTVATVELGSRSFVATHHGDGTDDQLQNVRKVVLKNGESDAIDVPGHTHQLVDEAIVEIRILNPGSATGAFPTTKVSIMRVTATNRSVTVEILERDKTLRQHILGYRARLKTTILR